MPPTKDREKSFSLDLSGAQESDSQDELREFDAEEPKDEDIPRIRPELLASLRELTAFVRQNTIACVVFTSNSSDIAIKLSSAQVSSLEQEKGDERNELPKIPLRTINLDLVDNTDFKVVRHHLVKMEDNNKNTFLSRLQGVPATCLFMNGKLAKVMLGVRSTESIRREINELLAQ